MPWRGHITDFVVGRGGAKFGWFLWALNSEWLGRLRWRRLRPGWGRGEGTYVIVARKKKKNSDSTFLSDFRKKAVLFGRLPGFDRLLSWWRWMWTTGGMILTGYTEVLGEKRVPVTLCPPQISSRLTWDRTQASAVIDQRLTAWAMARVLKVGKWPELCTKN